jgi:hypothetical protein
MRLILFFVGGIVLANIVWATFFSSPRAAQQKAYTTENSATKQGQDAWIANEKYNVPGRESIRKGALATLGKPWSTFCSEEGHKNLLGTINNYFYQRNAQASSYGNTYGDAAKQYVLKAWQTTDDNRIQRLMSETYERGYYSLDELRPYARTPLADLVKGTKITAKPCAG